jgi:hypothetical protein
MIVRGHLRTTKAERDVPTLLPRGPLGASLDALGDSGMSPSAAEKETRAAGFEPATSGSGADSEGVARGGEKVKALA